jgi:hypothetical protein
MTMKYRLILTGSFLALSAILSLAANAAPDTTADKTIEKARSKKQARPHSHMEGKTGIQASAPDAKQEKPKNPLHDHGKIHKQQ